MVDRSSRAQLPIICQAQLLSLSRSGLYYRSRPVCARELHIKHCLDELFTEHPFLGSRKIARLLADRGLVVGRHAIRRYRQQMGLETIYPKPRLSRPGGAPEHRVYASLLRDLVISQPNQVWGVDITYIRLSQGWMYLVAFLDWYSRYVVAWELSDTLEMDFVLTCSEQALSVATPQIINSDQGSHFTCERFTGRLLGAGGAHLDGWERTLYGQHLHRASVALGEVRRGVPVGVWVTPGGAPGAVALPVVL